MLVNVRGLMETSQLIPGFCPSSSSVKFVTLASLAGAEATVGKWEPSGPAQEGGGSKEEGPGGEGSPGQAGSHSGTEYPRCHPAACMPETTTH